MFQLISNLIQWALFFGAVGGLVDVTIAMRDQAARANATGLIRLSTLDQSLHWSQSKKHKH